MAISKFEQAKNVRQFLVNAAAEVISYSWDDVFARGWLRTKFAEAHKALTDNNLDPREFTRDQLYELGFGSWDGQLVLVPLYWHPALPEGMVLTSISGKTYVVGQDTIDNDVRQGCIAFGFIPKEATDSDLPTHETAHGCPDTP